MKNVVTNTEKQVNNVVNKVNAPKMTRKIESAKIESNSINLLNAVKNDEMNNFSLLIKDSNNIESLNELKNKITISSLTSKDKLNLKKVINSKVFNIKIECTTINLIEKNKDIIPLTEKASFKNQVGKNLLNLNNIIKAIKTEDKARIFDGVKISSKYSFLFNRQFTNSVFYSFLTLRQFSKLSIKDDIFNHNSIIEYCERIVKFDSIKLEIQAERGKQIYELLKDDSKTFEIKIVEFTKL
jgi:hypothetical protein